MTAKRFAIDARDPRAPPLEVWERMSEAERAEVVAALPPELPWDVSPPEGDAHRIEKSRALESLDAYFKKIGRRVYLSNDLAVYYPGEARFAPDLLAVPDVEPHPRDTWVVAAEGKGLDFVLEVLVHGDASKDLRENVARYARLGIPEYFAFDKTRGRLLGHALPGPKASAYQPIVPQEGRWSSRVLALDLGLEAGRLRFYAGTAVVLDTGELLARANALLSDVLAKHDEAERRAEQERARAEELARRVAELEAELERSRRK